MIEFPCEHNSSIHLLLKLVRLVPYTLYPRMSCLDCGEAFSIMVDNNQRVLALGNDELKEVTKLRDYTFDDEWREEEARAAWADEGRSMREDQ